MPQLQDKSPIADLSVEAFKPVTSCVITVSKKHLGIVNAGQHRACWRGPTCGPGRLTSAGNKMTTTISKCETYVCHTQPSLLAEATAVNHHLAEPGLPGHLSPFQCQLPS
jgi:hypothetical protein